MYHAQRVFRLWVPTGIRRTVCTLHSTDGVHLAFYSLVPLLEALPGLLGEDCICSVSPVTMLFSDFWM